MGWSSVVSRPSSGVGGNPPSEMAASGGFHGASMVRRLKMGSSVALDRFNGGRRFLGDVIGDADDAGHFCCDSLGQSVQHIKGEPGG